MSSLVRLVLAFAPRVLRLLSRSARHAAATLNTSKRSSVATAGSAYSPVSRCSQYAPRYTHRLVRFSSVFTCFPNGGAFKCHEQELEALKTNEATEDAFEATEDASFESSRQVRDKFEDKRVVATCRVEDTGQLEFVDLRESVWVNVGALLCVFLALRLATYLALRFVTLKPR